MFVEFLLQEWMWVGALLSCVLLLLFHESRRAGKSLSPQEVSLLINKEQAVVIDLRDAAEFRAGHIVTALNIPFNKINERVGELEAHKDKPLVLVDKIGQHSGAVGKQLAQQGFARVYRLGGGIGEWRHMQLPLVK